MTKLLGMIYYGSYQREVLYELVTILMVDFTRFRAVNNYIFPLNKYYCVVSRNLEQQHHFVSAFNNPIKYIPRIT